MLKIKYRMEIVTPTSPNDFKETKINDIVPEQSDIAHQNVDHTEAVVQETVAGLNEIEQPTNEARPLAAKVHDERPWDAAASLYCPRNGRLHSTLLDFDYLDCPKCLQSLRSIKFKSPISSRSSSISGSSSPITADNSIHENEGESREEPKKEKVKFKVRFRTKGALTISKEDWPQHFDLAEARKDVIGSHGSSDSNSASVFTVRTDVETSLTTRDYDIISSRRVFADPNIDVGIAASTIIIHSRPLIKALSDFAAPTARSNANALKIREPFTWVGQQLEEIEEKQRVYEAMTADSSESTEMEVNVKNCEHIGLLLDFIKKHFYKSSITEEKARHARNMCTFRMLWLLYKPGTTVYMDRHGYRAAFVIRSLHFDPRVLQSSYSRLSPYSLNLWYLDYNGRWVGRAECQGVVPMFEGEKDITTLRVVPAELFDKFDKGKTRQELENYGRKWYDMLLGKQIWYSGEPYTKTGRQVSLSQEYLLSLARSNITGHIARRSYLC